MKALKYWWPAVAWACAIFFFSTEIFGGADTSRFIIPFLRWLLPHAHPEMLWRIHFLIRKIAHVVVYFVFSGLVLRGVRGEAGGWNWRWGVASLLICAAYAALDEFHQSFVPGRGAAPTDVLLDSAGAVLAQLAAFFRGQEKRNTDEHR
jgi:VanZ family protein